jgi:hypothetical protein
MKKTRRKTRAARTATASFNGAPLTPGNPGNSGGKPGRSGRKPAEFKRWLIRAATDRKARAALRLVLSDAKHPHFAAIWRALLPTVLTSADAELAATTAQTVGLVIQVVPKREAGAE